MKLKIALTVLLLAAAASPAFADSKSVTVQVSCTVPAMMELVSPQARIVQANTNLEKQYRMTEDLRIIGGRSVKLYSLTAL